MRSISELYRPHLVGQSLGVEAPALREARVVEIARQGVAALAALDGDGQLQVMPWDRLVEGERLVDDPRALLRIGDRDVVETRAAAVFGWRLVLASGFAVGGVGLYGNVRLGRDAEEARHFLPRSCQRILGVLQDLVARREGELALRRQPAEELR